MRPTFHLVPEAVWAGSDPSVDVRGRRRSPARGSSTAPTGSSALGATFDRHYAADARSFLALTVDLDALDVPWRYDDPGSPYPHIYGPIGRAAVQRSVGVDRGPDGRFAGLTPA